MKLKTIEKKKKIKLIESVKIEKDKLNQLQAEKINLKSKKQQENAVKIQSFFRGYLVRKQYSKVIQEKIENVHQKRFEERVKKAEIERKKASEKIKETIFESYSGKDRKCSSKAI